MKNFKTLTIISFLICLGGCAQVTETVKVIYGSSTRALEEAKSEAITKKYSCQYAECFDSILTLARPKLSHIPFKNDLSEPEVVEDGEEVAVLEISTKSGFFDIFIEDYAKGHIVVMGIAGNVDTTEVGIFLSSSGKNSKNTQIEISSLSSSAKRTLAEIVFEHLNQHFSEK